MRKVLGLSLKVGIILFLLATTLFLGVAIYSLTILKVPLDTSKIIESSLKIDVFNANGFNINKDNLFYNAQTSIDKIPNHVINAFLAIEDKNFFSHHGINIKRMGKAFINNIFSFSLKEGASTITQQLIKNTHLSSAKNFPRKINEIVLALELEHKMSKTKILENYLNVIYFGSGAYGIESASQHFFSKPVQKLSVEEAALLAGIIKSPNRYSPIIHPNLATKRRNLVLNEMKNDGLITQKEFYDYSHNPINLNLSLTPKNTINSYSQSAIDEACKILNITERQLALSKFKIYTYQDLTKQNKMKNTIANTVIDSDIAMIDLDPQNGAVLAYYGQSPYKILAHPRQIGSIAKPILVYGPAINENILSPSSLILDEPLQIGSYCPKNVSGKYMGYVTTRVALSKSLNIPAVKTASYVGLDKIFSYAQKLNIALDEKDRSYALALGGLTYGFNLKDVCGAYTALANNGKFTKPSFVKYIVNADGKVIYKNSEETKQVFRDDTAFLLTDILKTSAQTGTAKKLKDLNFDVASKTGTVGTTKGNLDAYNVSYTTEDIVGVWMGNMDNKFVSTAGGNQPTAIAKEYYKKIYASQKPKNFSIPSSVEKVGINRYELEQNHRIIRATPLTPLIETNFEYFSRFNLPQNIDFFSDCFNSIKLMGYVENQKAILRFYGTSSLIYRIYKTSSSGTELLKTFSKSSGNLEFVDPLPAGQKAEYFLEIENPLISYNSKFQSTKVVLISPKNKTVNQSRWYI